MVAPVFAAGMFEILYLIALSGSGGIPLGIPPAPEDPLMAQLAPEKCLVYATWSSVTAPNPDSENSTEQLLAGAEIQHMIRKLDSAIFKLTERLADGATAPETRLAAETVPVLVKTILTRSTAFYLADLEIDETGVQIDAGMVVHLDAKAAEVKAMLEKLQEAAFADDVEILEIDGGRYYRIRPGPDPIELTWGIYQGKYLMVTLGEDAMAPLLANCKTDAPKWLQQLRSRRSIERVASVSFLDVKGLLELVPHDGGLVDPHEIFRQIGLDRISTYESMTGLDETGYVERSSLQIDGGLGGLMSLLDEKPLGPDDLKRIPHNALMASVVRINPGKTLDRILELVEAVDPDSAEQFQQVLGTGGEVIGTRIREDLLESFGDVLCIYASPDEGNLVTGWVASITVQDQMTLQQVHQRLIELAREAAGDDRPQVEFRTLQHNGRTIHFVSFRDSDVPFVPSWSLGNGELVVGLFPQAIKAHIDRVVDARPSLADRPEIAAALVADQVGPGSVQMLSYYDSPEMTKLVYPLLQMYLQLGFSMFRGEGEFDFGMGDLPSVAAWTRSMKTAVTTVRRTDDGLNVVVQQTLPSGSVGASLPLMAAVTLPAVSGARIASRRTQSANNMRQLGIAMHNYMDVYGGFPAAYSVDEEGAPLLSWRVHLLPYIEEQALYDRFRLDEPWDSEHNRELIPLMPRFLATPGRDPAEGKTNYLGVSGDKGVFVEPDKGLGDPTKAPVGTRIREVTDGTSNTIAIVEVNDTNAVTWTKPDDFGAPGMQPMARLTGVWKGGFQALFCDASIRFLADTTDKETLERLFDKSDGKVVEIE